MPTEKLPLIGVTGDTHPDIDADYYKVGDKYILSVVRAANCLAVMIPPIGSELEVDQLLDRLDGIVFTGSPSDLEPHHYGAEPEDYDVKRDLGRDATTLPMLKHVLQRDIPLFCICRGHQELNATFGGTMHQQVHKQAGVMDHRADPTKPYDVRYGPQHAIAIKSGGVLDKISGGLREAMVNTVHGQAIDKIGVGLRLEAEAPDGVVEAISVEGRKAFNISVQWHPEHQVALDEPLNKQLFEAFGAAARDYMNEK